MTEEDVVCRGTSLSHKKESNRAIGSDVGGTGDYHTKRIHTETEIMLYHLYAESKKDTNELIYKTGTQENKLLVIKAGWEGEGIWDGQIDTASYKITDKDLLRGTRGSAQHSVTT